MNWIKIGTSHTCQKKWQKIKCKNIYERTIVNYKLKHTKRSKFFRIRHPGLNLSYRIAIRAEWFNVNQRSKFEDTSCSATSKSVYFLVLPFRILDVPLLLERTRVHTYVLCTQTNTREHLRGVQDFLVTKVIYTYESRREKREKEMGGVIFLRNGNT